MASVGSVNISVNYVVNNNSMRSVNNSINQLQNRAPRLQTAFTSAFSKIGTAMVAAFSVKAITEFTKKATQLASDLQEVQNVVDVVFGSMSSEIDAFAKSAMRNFGVGETAAKKYAGTYAAMAQSFKFTNEEVMMLSKNLTRMVGDTASFRNVTHDIANTKLKAIFTGETEALKEWGIVMTQAALQEYAYSRGITKKIQKMTEQEKVILRYNFVMNKLQNDMGDFQRTQTGWANQTRIVSDKISTIIGTFGSGFITILTPALNALSQFLDLLQVAADKFASFVALLYGKKATANEAKAQAQIAAIGATATSTSDDLSDLAEGYEAVGASASKANESLASFDNVVQLADAPSGSGSGADNGGGGASFALDQYNFEDAGLEDTETIIDRLVDKLNGLKDRFGTLTPSASNFLQSYVNSLKVTGDALLKTGESVVKSLMDGFALWLEQGRERIAYQWSEILNNFAGGFDNLGVITTSIGNLLSNFFSLESTQQAIANCMTAVEGTISGTYLILSGLFEELSYFIAQTIEDNYLQLDTFFADVSTLLSTTTGTVSSMITDSFSSLYDAFDTYIRPAFKELQEGFSKAFGTILDYWNQYIAPLIQTIANSFANLWTNHLSPFVDEVMGMAAAFVECVSTIINIALKPALDFFLNQIIPPITVGLQFLWGAVEGLVQNIIDIATGLVQFIKGIFEVISGILQGDWKKICDGMLNILDGLIKAIANIFSSIVNLIIGGLNGLIRAINTVKIPGTDVGANLSEIKRFEPKILLADGGIVYKPTDFGSFVAGEAGAEAIVPLENSSYTQTLAREIVKGMVSAGMVGDTYNISAAYLDKRGLERLTQDINGVNRQIGARKGVISYG